MSEAAERVVEATMKIANAPIDEAVMPQARGWTVIVEPIEVESYSRGGIALPDSALEAKEHLRFVGQVIGMGPLAYKHEKFLPPGKRIEEHTPEPWCQIGDWVVFDPYAGQDMSLVSNGRRHKLKAIPDDHIKVVVPDPRACLIYE